MGSQSDHAWPHESTSQIDSKYTEEELWSSLFARPLYKRKGISNSRTTIYRRNKYKKSKGKSWTQAEVGSREEEDHILCPTATAITEAKEKKEDNIDESYQFLCSSGMIKVIWRKWMIRTTITTFIWKLLWKDNRRQKSQKQRNFKPACRKEDNNK